MQNILIVDRDAAGQAQIVSRLEEHGFSVTILESGAQALEEVIRLKPALMLLDLSLSDVPGTEVLKRVREDPQTRQLPVVLVTERGEEIDRVIGFELGADDYVTKPYSPRELMLRVLAVLRRAKVPIVNAKDILAAGPMRIHIGRHEVVINDDEVPLTALEFRLLIDLAERKGRVQRRDELLERVWQYPSGLDTRTVDTHVKRLREKLGDAGRWIETVRGVGYRMRE
ncbi:MAG: response regulator transcription factor [Myxococcota bacterium]